LGVLTFCGRNLLISDIIYYTQQEKLMIVKETDELKKAVALELLIPDPCLMKAKAILESDTSEDDTDDSEEISE
jgi:hypothetical protein